MSGLKTNPLALLDHKNEADEDWEHVGNTLVPGTKLIFILQRLKHKLQIIPNPHKD